MAWVSSGTVTVTNGNATVTGAGTDWFGAMQNGWGFVGPDGRVYEILTVDSADTITLKTPYQGATAAAQAYAVFPTGSHNLDLVAALQELLGNYQGVYDTVGQGRFAGDIVFDADRDTGMGNPSSNEVGLKAGGDWQLRLKGGQASGAAVQSNYRDPTNGRLLRMFDHVGPFDLGSRRTEVVGGSLNDTMDQGYTRFLAWNTEATDTPWNYGLGLQIMAYDTTGNQLAFRRGAYPAMAFRGTTDANLNFSEWLELFHTHNIVGTVGQTDGTPTGAVIERGSNANGEYVRFADGTQICTHELTLGAPNVAHGNNYTDASATTWVYPATFANGASVSGHNVDVGNCWLSAYGNSNSQTSLRSMRAVSTSVAPTFRLMAIGRWF